MPRKTEKTSLLSAFFSVLFSTLVGGATLTAFAWLLSYIDFFPRQLRYIAGEASGFEAAMYFETDSHGRLLYYAGTEDGKPAADCSAQSGNEHPLTDGGPMAVHGSRRTFDKIKVGDLLIIRYETNLRTLPTRDMLDEISRSSDYNRDWGVRLSQLTVADEGTCVVVLGRYKYQPKLSNCKAQNPSGGWFRVTPRECN